jgi:hypothetical protein
MTDDAEAPEAERAPEPERERDSARMRRRDRRALRAQTQTQNPIPKETPMAPPRTTTAVLTERPDDLIDQRVQEIGADYLVVCSLFRGVPGAMGGGTWPGIRAGIHVPIVRVKEIAQACSDLLVGGARIKVVVETVDDSGNKHRVLPPWFETFDGAPRAGAHWDGLTIAWDPQEGGGNGAFVAVPRQGFAAVNTGPVVGAGHGPTVGPQFAPGAAFPRVERGADGRLLPPPPGLVPGYLRQYPVDQQWDSLANEYARVNGGRRPSLEPVTVALDWKDERTRDLDRANVQAARYEERYESIRDRAQQQLEAEKNARMALERRLAEMETRAARELGEAQAKSREDRLLAKIEAMEQRMAAAPSSASGIGALAPFAPAIATVLAGWVQSNADQAARQSQMMLAIATKPEKSGGGFEAAVPMIAAVSPIVGPLLLQYMQNQSPAALAELRDQSHMQGQAMISMMMEFIKWSTPSEAAPPWWLDPLKSAIDGVVGAAKVAAMNQPRALPQQHAIVQQPSPQPAPTIDLTGQPEAAPPPRIVVPALDLDALIARFTEIDRGAAQMTELVMGTLAERGFDPRILTHEWASIIFAMHRREPQRELAARVVDHLEHSRDYALLPGPLMGVFDDPDPIGVFIGMMPVAQADTAYTKVLVEAIVGEIRSRESERKRALAETDDASGETEVEDKDEDEDVVEAEVAEA